MGDLKFGFVKDENNSMLKEVFTNNIKLKAVLSFSEYFRIIQLR